jgi:hypothetical protein
MLLHTEQDTPFIAFPTRGAQRQGEIRKLIRRGGRGAYVPASLTPRSRLAGSRLSGGGGGCTPFLGLRLVARARDLRAQPCG